MAGPIVASIRTQEALQRDLTLGRHPVRHPDPPLDRPVLPAVAGRAVRQRAGGAGHGAGLRRRRPGLRLPHQRHQLPGGLRAWATAPTTRWRCSTATSRRRGAGQPLRTAVLTSCAALWRPTGVAALASAVSYASLMITGFRGFSQFGLIGAAGCLLAWAATFTVLPAALCLFDRRPLPAAAPGRRSGSLSRLGGVDRRPARGLPAGRGGGDPVPADRRRPLRPGALRIRLSQAERGRRSWTRGRAPSTATTMPSSAAGPSPTGPGRPDARTSRPLRTAIRQADAELPKPRVIGDIFSVWDLLPGSPSLQGQKLAVLAELPAGDRRPRPGAGQRDGSRRAGQGAPARHAAEPAPPGPPPAGPPPLHRGGRDHRARAARLPAPVRG